MLFHRRLYRLFLNLDTGLFRLAGLPALALFTLILTSITDLAIWAGHISASYLNANIICFCIALTASRYFSYVSHRRRIEKMRKELEEPKDQGLSHFYKNISMIEATLDNMNQGLVMVAASGELQILTKRAKEYAGVANEPLNFPISIQDIVAIQRRVGEFGPNGELFPKEVLEYAAGNGGMPPPIYRRKRPNGMIIEVRTELIPGGGFVQSYTDLTELVKAKDDAEPPAKAKATFLATMSHEIRTPLNGVLGMVTLLEHTRLSTSQRDYLQGIKNCGDALLATINDILDFSKLEAGKMDIELAPFDLQDTMRSAIDLVRFSAESKNLKLTGPKENLLKYQIMGDRIRVRQILINLLGNAIKFTNKGSVTLDAHVRIHQGEEWIKLSITDTGIGISPEAQKKLFDDFTQVDASITRRFGGTGLGLSICKRLVDAMEGNIGIDSTPGVGSTFWFEIPYQEVNQKAMAPIKALDITNNKSLFILLVEDIRANQLVAEGMLKILGHTCKIANNGLEALEILKETKFDIILMDMQMPELDGLEATRRLRAMKNGMNQDTYVIALTANGFDTDQTACLAAGMNDFLAKPIELARLKEALQRAPLLKSELEEGDILTKEQAQPDPTRIKTIVGYLGAEEYEELLHALEEEYQPHFNTLAVATQTPRELMDLMQRDLLDLGLMPIANYKNGKTPTYSVEDARHFFEGSIKAGYEYIEGTA